MKKYLVTYIDEHGRHMHYVEQASDDIWALAQVASNTDASTISTAGEFLDKTFGPADAVHVERLGNWLDNKAGKISDNETVLLVYDLNERTAVWELEGEFHK